MDLDPDWRNREEISQIQWKNTQPHFPSPYSNFKSHGNLIRSDMEYSDPTYISDGDLSNPSHLPYCSSPERFGHFESHLSNEMNRNMKYPSYLHRSLRCNNESSTYSYCHPFHSDFRWNAEQKAKKYYPQTCQHQLANMCYDPHLSNNYSTKTNATALNAKKRRKTNESKSKRTKAVDSSDNAGVNCTYEELIINSDNSLHSWSRTSSSPTTTPQVSHDAPGIDSFTNFYNRQHFFPEKNEELCNVRKDNFSNIYSFGSKNNMTSEVGGYHENLNTSTRNDNNCNKPIKEENGVNNDLEVSDIVNSNIRTVISGRNEEMSTVEDTPSDVTTENTDIQIRDSVYTEEGLENVILQPIFEGKDENGEDVIVLLASSAIHQEIPQENSNIMLHAEFISSQMTDGLKVNTESIPQNDTQFNTLAEFQTKEVEWPINEINPQKSLISKTLNENYNEFGLQMEGKDIFFSNINDFVGHEVEVALENKSSNIKRTKKKESQPICNSPLKKKSNQRKNNILQMDDSKTTELEEVYASNYSSLTRNRNKLKASYKPSKFKRKSKYRCKSTMQFKSFKNLFISEMINLFKVKDVSINRNRTWEMMKNQIGCSVLQSIFTTIQLLAKSEIQECRSTISKKK